MDCDGNNTSTLQSDVILICNNVENVEINFVAEGFIFTEEILLFPYFVAVLLSLM